jgi:hypothetical protein
VQELLQAEHAVSISDAAIFGRRSGPSSTSITEALLCSVRQGLTLLHQQVVRPRRRRSGWRIKSFAGSMVSSILDRISTESSRGRRRWVAEAPRDLIAFLFLS